MGVQIGRNKGGDSCPEGVIGTEVAMSGVGNDLISQTTDTGDSENAVASIGVRLPKREQSPSHKRSTPANHGNRLENHLGQCARQGRRLTVCPAPAWAARRSSVMMPSRYFSRRSSCDCRMTPCSSKGWQRLPLWLGAAVVWQPSLKPTAAEDRRQTTSRLMLATEGF